MTLELGSILQFSPTMLGSLFMSYEKVRFSISMGGMAASAIIAASSDFFSSSMSLMLLDCYSVDVSALFGLTAYATVASAERMLH